jgi:hypothetical protein
MRFILLALAIFISSKQLLCQTRTGNVEMLFPLVAIIETYKIKTQNIDQIEWEMYLKNPINNEVRPDLARFIGTGFFIAKEVDLYFVTAEHVALTTNINTTIQLSLDDRNPLKFKLADLVDPQYISNNKVKWITHPDADVSVIPISNKYTILKGIPYEIVLNKLEAPLRERNLIVYGFPLGLGAGKKISPISKRYNPSSGLIDLNRFDNGKPSVFYLIDDPSISGLSGGPVIAFPQKLEHFDGTSISMGDHQVLGLVHGTISKDGGGYGAIVPAKFILETLDLAPSYNGKYIFKYNDGKIWSEVIYKNGLAWEVISNYKRNGMQQEKGTLKDGNGTAYNYDENEKLEFIFHYRNGLIIKYEKMN